MNESSDINVRGWLSRGWKTFTDHPIPLIGGAIIVTIFSMTSIGLNALPHSIFRLLSFLCAMSIPIVTVGWASLCLQTLRGRTTTFWDVFIGFSTPWRSWATPALAGIIAGFGCILLVIPGVIWFLKSSLMSPFAVLDKGLNARGNIRYSGKITKGFKGRLLIISCINVLASILVFPFIFGLQFPRFALSPDMAIVAFVPFAASVLILTPWLGASYAAAYDTLSRRYDAGQASSPVPAPLPALPPVPPPPLQP